jgi:hypothetical protein
MRDYDDRRGAAPPPPIHCCSRATLLFRVVGFVHLPTVGGGVDNKRSRGTENTSGDGDDDDDAGDPMSRDVASVSNAMGDRSTEF